MGADSRGPGVSDPPTSGWARVARPRRRPLPAVRIGLASGLAGILCCVGPTVLALIGVLGARTAYAWAEGLYAGYAWWFRIGGLMVLVALTAVALRRRGWCDLRGLRAARGKLLVALGVAAVTYVALYAVTTALGTLA